MEVFLYFTLNKQNMKKILVLILLLFILACEPPYDNNYADQLIQKSEELKNIGFVHEEKVGQITRGEFTIEKAEQAEKELSIALNYYNESLNSNNEAVRILESLKNASLQGKINDRQFFSKKTSKTIECGNLGIALLNAAIAREEATLNQEMQDLLDKSSICNEELRSMRE